MTKRLTLLSLVLALVAGVLSPAATAGRAKPKPRPDLAVASITAAARVQQGRTLPVAAVVRNAGRRSAGTTSTRFTLSSDRTVGSDRALGPVRSTPRLAPRRSTRVRASVTVPVSVRPGRYWVVACADVGRRVQERNERDNCRVSAKPVVVAARSTPPTTPPSPPTPPTPGPPPSSQDLIDADVAAGRITADQGLVFRVFSDFEDARLPARYVGKPNGLDEGALGEVTQRWGELSRAHQEQLRPFLIPPYYAGSHWSPSSTPLPPLPRTDAHDTGRRRAFDAPWCAAIGTTVPTLETWEHLDTRGGDVRVWWLAANTADAATAAHYVEILDDAILPALGSLMGTGLLPDGDGNCAGGSDALDIALVDASTATTFGDDYTACSAVPSRMAFPRTPETVGWSGADPYLAHEVMHAFQLARPTAGSCTETSWVREMTAQWVQDYVTDPSYGIGLGPDDTEHQAAPKFMGHPAVPLDVAAPPVKHDYGAYLLPQWVARNGDLGFVKKIWDGLETQPPKQAIDAAMPPGGFAASWDEFVLSTWNRGAVPHFRDWDGLQAWAEITAEVEVPDPGTPVPQYVPVPHLAAQFLDVEVGPKIKELEVTHDKPGDPSVTLRAHLFYDDGTTDVVDLSRNATTVLCIDDGLRRATSVVLIYSNADLDEEATVTTTLVGSTTCGCQNVTPGPTASTAARAPVCLEGNVTYTYRDDWDGDDEHGRREWLGREDESGSLSLSLVDDGSGDFVNGPGSTFSATGRLEETWFRHQPDGCGDTTVDRTVTASGPMQPDRAFAFVDRATGDLLLSAGISQAGRAVRHVDARCVQSYDEEQDLLVTTPRCAVGGLTPFYRLKPVATGSKTYTMSCRDSWTTDGPDHQHHRHQSTVEATITLP